MAATDEGVFLLDVDNTLLDNDRVQDDLRNHFERELGAASRDRYWAIFEALRTGPGYADYLGALQRYPARHDVMVEDKLRILAAMKRTWGVRLTTICPRQGHYALDPGNLTAYPPAYMTIERIGDLVNADSAMLFGNDAAGRTSQEAS